MQVRFSLLGALTVHDGAEEVPVAGPILRSLLATLLLRANRPVTMETLCAALWGDSPPESAHASLHNHVARLRRAIGADRIRSVAGGYLLAVGDGESDVEEFTGHLQRARSAVLAEDWETVSAAVTAALTLWRGRPLSDRPRAAETHPEVEQLVEMRLQALEWRFDAALHQGRDQGLVAELANCVAEHPLREAFHRQLMLCLYRAGRRAEALEVYHRLRRTLVAELGVEPGPAVQEAHQRILTDSEPQPVPAPAGEMPQAEAARVAAPIPAQLPPTARSFVGRGEQMDNLRAVLGQDAGRPRLAVVCGMAGVGKTALAVETATALRDVFPDGQLFLRLNGATTGLRPLSPWRALAILLRDLGVRAGQLPTGPDDTDAAAALLRSVLAPTRTLLVLDDAATAAQVRPLLPAAPGCAVLVTSRSPLATLEAVTIALDPLTEDDSLALVRLVSGRGIAEGVTSADGSVRRLVELCGRLPLALRVISARLAARRSLSIDAVVASLTVQQQRLDQLDFDDLSVRGSLSVAYQALAQADSIDDRTAALAFRRLGLLHVAHYSPPVAARLMGVSHRRAEAALNRLVDVALLEEVQFGHYVPHDLVRDVMRELALSQDGDDAVTRAAATERAVHWYAAMTSGAARAVLPPGHRWVKPLTPPDDIRVPSDADEAVTWFDAERANLMALLGQPDLASLSTDHIIALSLATSAVLMQRGHFETLLSTARTLATLAEAHGSDEARILAHNYVAAAHWGSGRPEASLQTVDHLIDVCRAIGDDYGMRAEMSNRGMLLRELGRMQEADAALHECLRRCQEAGDLYNEALTLTNIGNIHYVEDRPQLAIGYYEQSIAVGRKLDMPIVELQARCNIGHAHLALGDNDSALHHFEAALAFTLAESDWVTEREIRLGLSRSLRAVGEYDRADGECVVVLDRALAQGDIVSQRLGHTEHGHVLHAAGRHAEARAAWEAALLLCADDVTAEGEYRSLIASADQAAQGSSQPDSVATA
ncbi:BTAD domain-containing putative transcriptional regulator [Streptomyces sp. NPDC001315]|uniref:AfsR/SARP family transcriptional regulator n=1 Tax=Streptomyces sp. NPDC001315 TaxID=3364562 RepID=UPI0036D131FD